MQSEFQEAAILAAVGDQRERRETAQVETSTLSGRLVNVLIVAGWFGLLAGLVEGVVANALRGLPSFAVRVSPEILWIAPAVNLILFVFLGGILGLSFMLMRKALGLRWQIAFFSAGTVLCLLLLLGKLNQIAAIVLSIGVGTQIARRVKGREVQTLAFLKRSAAVLIIVAIVSGATGAFWERGRERYQVGKLPPAPIGAPNILLITLDTLRADHLSNYGYNRETSPNIARLAEEGVLFENAFTNSSWTLPAHASLFTGRLPVEHKADWTTPLNNKYKTLAEDLGARGYLTGAFAANISYATPEWGLGRGFMRYEAHGSSLIEDATSTVYGKKLALNVLPRVGYFDIPGRKKATQVNDEFFEWVNQTSGKPFFAFLNYFDLHDPYLTNDPYRTRFSPEVTKGESINFQFQPSSFRRKAVLSPDEIQAEINSYDGCLAYLDARFGELMEELQRRGLDKNTLVIVTSDHGEAFGNHDLFGHGNSLYLETLRVPLIFIWPGHLPAGRRISQAVSLHDIPSTIIELLGASASFPGTSLAKTWTGPSQTASTDPVISELSPGRFKDGPPNYPAARGGLKSLLTDEWHLIVSASGGTELFAWREDPKEQNNLAETPMGKSVVQDLKQRLNSRFSSNGE